MLIINGTVLTFGQANEVITDGAVLVEGDRIADVGPAAEMRARHPHAETLDAGGRLIMPGLICAHTHFYGAFARGMALPGDPPANFPEILEKLWWRLDKLLGPEEIRYSALVCLVDAIHHGTTTLLDHHASPNAIDGSLDVLAEAVRQAGVRAGLCYEVTDRDGPERAAAGIRENTRFIAASRQRRDPLVAGTFGLHASLTLSDKTLDEASGAARELGVGVHIHVAEDMADQRDSLQKSGLRVVERLDKFGVLGPGTIAAHCVHVDGFELDLLRESGTRVAHNPRSNMNNAVGTADVPGMLKRGISVGLGNDGFPNNMFTEMGVAYLVHKMATGDPRVMGADQVLRIAFHNNAAIAGQFFPGPLGELSPGAAADVILVDYVPPTPLIATNLPWHLIFGVDGTGVDTVLVGGKVLMRNRELLTLDEVAICDRARELAVGVWRRIE